jgi:hypothetical protein
LFLDSENGEKKALNEVDGPCCAIKDKEAVREDETMTHAEDIEVREVPAQQETVSYPPLLAFDNALPCDEEEEEDECSNVSNPVCYNIDSDAIDNIDEFIHVGRRRWDIVGYDLDPIYGLESHFQLLLPQQITFDQWQQGDEVFTHTSQRTKDDPIPYFSDDFRSYLEEFDDCSPEHLDLFYEDDCQSPICSDFDTSENIVCLRKASHGFSLQPPVVALLCLSIKGVLAKHIFDVEFPFRQTLNSRGWLGTVCFS